MAERGIRFLTPLVTTDVGVDELDVLRAELEKIADGSPRLAAAALAARLDSFIRPTEVGTPWLEPDDGERFALLRATDHLRNLGHKGALIELRDRIYGTGGVESIGYTLQPLRGGPTLGFASYSLEYEVGDRLVRKPGEEFRVVDLGEGDPPELVVDDWRPAE